MNPLKYRLPALEQHDVSTLHPQPSALHAWTEAQPTVNVQSTAPLLLTLLQRYNRCNIPAAIRLKASITLQPVIDQVINQLHLHYQHESLPLPKSAQAHAHQAALLLDESAFAYKRVVADSVSDTEEHNLSINVMVAALRLTIDQLGQQLLECYSQYSPPIKGLWGEFHRTYQLAERNGLHTQVLTEEGKQGDAHNPFATVQHGYLRAALLALTMPNHLMPGQASLIYGYLAKWTIGCRMLTNKGTEAKAGDIVIDLEGERPPAMATGYARFRPVAGRFLDISTLQNKLGSISASVNERQQSRHQPPLTIAERLRRDLLTRLRKAWQGRAERASDRKPDKSTHFTLGVGLDVCHHFISNETTFSPEQDEIQYHRPQETSSGLELMPSGSTLELVVPGTKTEQGLNDTRVSRFGEKIDVWDAIHETEIHARSKREAAMAHFRVEPWVCINQSEGGAALQRLPDTLSRCRVGAVVVYQVNTQADTNNEQAPQWKIGALRWLQNDAANAFTIGIMALANSYAPVAVRAIGGPGTGGEYFRSLLIDPVNPHTTAIGDTVADTLKDTVSKNTASTLLVPASIFDIGTQLVLNRQTKLEYVRLTMMIETTNAYSMFAFKHIEVPPAEQAKISAL